MGCSTCSVSKEGVPSGCGNKGHCSSGSCNKMNTFDWLTTMDLPDPSAFNMVEVSFKKGSRKAFYINANANATSSGDMVTVEAANGYDVGRITLSGELVRLQMKKKKVKEENIIHKVIRKAHNRDLEKLDEARNLEQRSLVSARKIARTLDLNMKIGDVEYQGDKRKATFFYTAEGRVDFRELVRMYAKEFKVKIEMRQIGSRQESARIGGLGTCGRELCCSTWLSDFHSVTTSAARYQNLAINQSKLSGQCGRLKCCLNYELDMYVEALDTFPKKIEEIRTKEGVARLLKLDIFKGLMFFSYSTSRGRGPIFALSKEKVHELVEMRKNGEMPENLLELQSYTVDANDKEEEELEYADVTGEIVLPELKKKKGRRNNRRKGPNNRNKNRSQQNRNQPKDSKDTKSDQPQQPKGEQKQSSGRAPKKKYYKKRRNSGGKKPTDKPNNNNNKTT